MTDNSSIAEILPISIEDLLHARRIESSRIEFKASWDGSTARGTGAQVLKTICAFANDVQSLNGGYIVIGVEERGGAAHLPPCGLDADVVQQAQKLIRTWCRNQLDPPYSPVLSPEVVDGRNVLVVWAPASSERPHQAPATKDGGERHYYVRRGADTIEARGADLTALMHLTAKVPFDDRRNLEAKLDDMRVSLAHEFLQDVGSKLVSEQDPQRLYRGMHVSARVNGHEVPRNVGLLFFTEDPEQWFRGARIEVAHFPGGKAGRSIEEKVFRGPLHRQLRDCIRYLENLSTFHLQKVQDVPQVEGWVGYPHAALEEAVVNAVCHRGYDGVLEPTKINLYADRMVISSYPGPVPGIEPRHFEPGVTLPDVPARNRRIGEFFKELGLAELRNSGVPAIHESMRENGSPTPTFLFDEGRTYFSVTLPAHPEYAAILALRDAAHLRATGDGVAALARLERAFEDRPESGTIAAALIDAHTQREERYDRSRRDLSRARAVYDRFMAEPRREHMQRVAVALASALIDADQRQEASKLLDALPAEMPAQEAIEAAILARRAKREEEAHRYFLQAGEAIWRDVRALHEFAQCKVQLARRGKASRDPFAQDARKRLLVEARTMLERVLQMPASPQRRAWSWFNLGIVLGELGAPRTEVRRAYEEAATLQPEESRFVEAVRRFG